MEGQEEAKDFLSTRRITAMHRTLATLICLLALAACGGEDHPDQPYWDKIDSKTSTWGDHSEKDISDFMDQVCTDASDPPPAPDGVSAEDHGYVVGLVLGSNRCSR